MSVESRAETVEAEHGAPPCQNVKHRLRLYQLHGFDDIRARLRQECGKLAQSSDNAWIPDSRLHSGDCAPTFVERVIAQLAEVLRQHSHLQTIAGAEYWVQVRVQDRSVLPKCVPRYLR